VRVGGDSNTVAQAAVDPFEPEADPMFVPSLRAVMDVGRWEESRFAIPGGQSGNPCSPHYEDQLPLWLSGEGIRMPWKPEDVEREARATLVVQTLGSGCDA
jgi:acyl-homoserine lactone acylase PvdQ